MVITGALISPKNQGNKMKYFDLKLSKNGVYRSIDPTPFAELFKCYDAVSVSDINKDVKTELIRYFINKNLDHIARCLNITRLSGGFVRESANAHSWVFDGENLKYIDRLRSDLKRLYPKADFIIETEENKSYASGEKITSRFD